MGRADEKNPVGHDGHAVENGVGPAKPQVSPYHCVPQCVTLASYDLWVPRYKMTGLDSWIPKALSGSDIVARAFR